VLSKGGNFGQESEVPPKRQGNLITKNDDMTPSGRKELPTKMIPGGRFCCVIKGTMMAYLGEFTQEGTPRELVTSQRENYVKLEENVVWRWRRVLRRWDRGPLSKSRASKSLSRLQTSKLLGGGETNRVSGCSETSFEKGLKVVGGLGKRAHCLGPGEKPAGGTNPRGGG